MTNSLPRGLILDITLHLKNLQQIQLNDNKIALPKPKLLVVVGWTTQLRNEIRLVFYGKKT